MHKLIILVHQLEGFGCLLSKNYNQNRVYSRISLPFVANDKSQWMVVMDNFSSSEGLAHSIFNRLVFNFPIFQHFMKKNIIELESGKLDRFV